MIRKIYGLLLILSFFGFISFLLIFQPKKIFNLSLPDSKNIKSEKVVVEQSIKGVYLVDAQKNNTNWELWAESGLSSSASSSWRFNNVKVHFYSKDKKSYNVTAEIGMVDLKKKIMIFDGDIFIDSPNGYHMSAKTLEYNFAKKIIFTNSPVTIDTNKKKVRYPLKFTAESMDVSLDKSKILLKKIKSTKFLKSGEVVKINSDESILSGNTYMVEYRKNVNLSGLKLKVSSDLMKVYVSKRAKQLKKIDAIGNVKVRSGTRLGTSGVATLNFLTEIIEMTKSPKLRQGNDLLFGEKIIFYNKTKSVSVKKARAKVDRNTLENYNEPLTGK